MPIPVRAIDSDARGQAKPGLSEAALMVLAQEVITRLSHWAEETAPVRAVSRPPLVEPDVTGLCDALLSADARLAKRMVMDAHRAGATHEELCLFHIGATAKRMGEMWDDDRISFRDVALAAGRMLHLLRDLRDLAAPFQPRGTRCALFATVPGEAHVIGPTMAADLFRDDGWDVDLALDTTAQSLSDMVCKGAYPIVGLSATNVERVRALARVIVELRLASPKILIFVSGFIAKIEPDIATRVGADGAAWDIDGCRKEMERLHTLVPQVILGPAS